MWHRKKDQNKVRETFYNAEKLKNWSECWPKKLLSGAGVAFEIFTWDFQNI